MSWTNPSLLLQNRNTLTHTVYMVGWVDERTLTS